MFPILGAQGKFFPKKTPRGECGGELSLLLLKKRERRVRLYKKKTRFFLIREGEGGRF